MSNMKIMSSISEWIETFPLIEQTTDIFPPTSVVVESLGSDIKSYMIQSEPVNPIVRRYMDGTSIRQFAIAFSSRESYGQETLQNIENSGFHEEFIGWVEKCKKDKNMPYFGANREVTKVTVTTTPYVFDTTATTAQYRMQMLFTYYQK